MYRNTVNAEMSILNFNADVYKPTTFNEEDAYEEDVVKFLNEIEDDIQRNMVETIKKYGGGEYEDILGGLNDADECMFYGDDLERIDVETSRANAASLSDIARDKFLSATNNKYNTSLLEEAHAYEMAAQDAWITWFNACSHYVNMHGVPDMETVDGCFMDEFYFQQAIQ